MAIFFMYSCNHVKVQVQTHCMVQIHVKSTKDSIYHIHIYTFYNNGWINLWFLRGSKDWGNIIILGNDFWWCLDLRSPPRLARIFFVALLYFDVLRAPPRMVVPSGDGGGGGGARCSRISLWYPWMMVNIWIWIQELEWM